MKKLLTFLLPFLLVGCSSFDEVSIQESPILASATTEEMTTRATLIENTATLVEVFPTMTIQTGSTKLDVATTELIKGNYNTGWYWGNSAKTFVSYPKGVINPTIGDNQMTFEYAPSTSMDDIVVAVDKKNNAPLQFDYKHIFCTVNVIYDTLQIAHKITDLYISGEVAGKCTVTPSEVKWSASTTGEGHNYKYASCCAYYEKQELTGEKFMFVPLSKPVVHITIDGKKLDPYTVSCVPQPGKIINVRINDKMKFTEEEKAVVDVQKKITKETNGTYTMTLQPYITGESITSEVAETTTVVKPMPMDYILVLDYSGSMKDSYSPTGDAIKSYKKGILASSAVNYYAWNKNQTGYKYYWGGVDQTIKCLKTGSRYYAYFDYGSIRYYIGPDGTLYKYLSQSIPSSSSSIYDSVYGKAIPYQTNTSDVIFKARPSTNVSVNSRLTALESSVFDFIDKVQKDMETSGVEHRISIVQFQRPRWPRADGANQSDAKKYVLPSYSDYYLKPYSPKSSGNSYGTTSLVSPFTTVSSAAAGYELKDALSLVNYGGSTAIDFGMYLAELQLKNCRSVDSKGKKVSKCVIVFTDGKPTHATGSIMSDHMLPEYGYKDGQVLSDADVAKKAVTIAGTCKNTYKAEVYTIFAGVTKDKPDNDTMTGIATDADHYTDASAGNLSATFKKIAESVVTTEEVTVEYPALKLGADAYILLKFSDLFDTSKAVVTGGTATWLDSKTVKISGFDYAKNFGESKKPTFKISGLTTACTSNACSLLPGSGLYTADGKLVEDYHEIDFTL